MVEVDAVVQTVAAIPSIALGAAALMHVVRYILLLINRTVLLNPWVAIGGSWLGIHPCASFPSLVPRSGYVLTSSHLVSWDP